MIYSKIHLDESKYIEIAHNYYSLKEEWDKMLDNEQHFELCKCVANRRASLEFTGQSACSIYEIARTDDFVMRPHCVTENHKSFDLICWRYGGFDPNARIVNGLRVASPERTISDLAKSDSLTSLLVSINDCLHKRLFTTDGLLEYVNNSPERRYLNKIKKLILVATPKCESPLETLAWLEINNEGFSFPTQQKIIYDKNDFVARVDMYWELKKGPMNERKIILELDGMGKYKTINDLYIEKRREDKLRALGYKIVRATWEDVKFGKFVALLSALGIKRRRYYIRGIIK